MSNPTSPPRLTFTRLPEGGATSAAWRRLRAFHHHDVVVVDCDHGAVILRCPRCARPWSIAGAIECDHVVGALSEFGDARVLLTGAPGAGVDSDEADAVLATLDALDGRRCREGAA